VNATVQQPDSSRTQVLRPFTYTALPQRVVFGAGTLGVLRDEVARLGVRRALVLATAQQEDAAHDIASRMGDVAAGIFAGAAMHTPVEISERAVERLRALEADGVVAIGGGSTTGLAKAIALRTDVPQLIVPTTYAGSEMTPVLGQTTGGEKTTMRSPAVLPEAVLYDVDLTLGLPVPLSVTSGLNAIAHAAEALYAENRNPITSLMARDAIAALARALPRIVASPRDIEARSDALYGAWLCGVCLGAVGMALHHKLCHVLGGSFDLPHAETHAVVLPHAIAFNTPTAPDAAADIAAAIGADDAGRGLADLARSLGAPTALRDLGMPENGIDRAADIAARDPYWNPRPVTRDAIATLIRRAWAGEAPAA
jgi:maleylacetate reductase